MIFFEGLNPKNSKVKKYVNIQKKYFKSLYTNEKNHNMLTTITI